MIIEIRYRLLLFVGLISLSISLNGAICPGITGITTNANFNCGPGSVTLGANPIPTNINTVMKWYDAPVGGNLLGTGVVFSTPNISITTTFYVDATLNGCTTNRSPVVATIYPKPTITTNPSVEICGPGQVTLTASGSSGSTIEWRDQPYYQGSNLLASGSSYTSYVSTTRTIYAWAVKGVCGVSKAVLITVKPLPTPSFQTSDFCPGSPHIISSVTPAGGVFTLLNNPTPSQTTINPTTGVISGGVNGNTYIIKYSVTQNGCIGFITKQVMAGNSTGLINLYGDASDKRIDDLFIDPVNNEISAVGRYGTKMFFTKLDFGGNEIFTKIYNRKYRPSSIIRTGNSFLIMADSSVSGSGDVFVIKTNNNGNILWSKRFATPNRDRNAKIIEVASNQFFIIFNNSTTPGGSMENIFVLKIDGNGNVIWKKQFDFGSDDELYSYAPNGNGGVVVAGGLNTGTRRGVLIEIANNGTIAKAKEVKNATSAYISEFANLIKTTGGYLTTGEIPDPNSSFPVKIDLSIRKFDNNLNLLWNKTIKVGTTDYPFIAFNGLTDDASGNFYISLKKPATTGPISQLLKFSSTGNLIWTKEFTGVSSINVKQANNAASNNIILYGNYSRNAFVDSFIIARTDTSFSSCLTKPSTSTVLSPSNYILNDLNVQILDSTILVKSESITESSLSFPRKDACLALFTCRVKAEFNFTSAACVGQPITFTNLSSDVTNKQINYYQWNFGEGTIQTGVQSPVHAYPAAGIYNVTLIAGYSEGCFNCFDTIEKQVVVSATCPGLNCEECIGSFAPIPGKKYIISAWAKEEGASPLITTYTNPKITLQFSPSGSAGPFGPKGLIIDGWQRIEEEFTIPPGTTNFKLKLSSMSGDTYFDDIRVFPFDGSMKSYVYDPITLRLTAELDERNYATLYEYDEEGKLIRIKKETERGIMTIQESTSHIKK
jgi:PKD repeat protein